MLALRVVLALLAAVIVVATVLPLSRSGAWWVRMFDFPRLQIAALGLAVLIGYAVVLVVGGASGWEGAALAVLGGAVIAQALQMRPYSPLHEVQTARVDRATVDPDRRLRLVATNVLMQNRDGERWLREIRRAAPDVVAAVETDEWWAEQAEGLTDLLPHTRFVPQDDTYGMCLLSRHPLESVEVRHLVEDEVPSLWATVRLPCGDVVSLTVLHPRPPRPDIQQDSDLRDAELVLAGRDLSERDGPVVIVGDLNDVAWSHTTRLFQRVSGLLDPRVGRGPFSTFHADHWWLRYPLDHVFHSDHFAISELRRLGHVGSDHFPILAELSLVPERIEDEQTAPDAGAEEHAEGDAKVEEARQQKADESPEEHAERVEEDQ